MIITEDDYLAHYGILRRSGRYPWGSGETQSERNKTFLDTVANLKKQGLSETQIVEGLGLESTTQLRALKSIAKNEQRQSNIALAERLKDKGYSNGAIAERMGLPNESSVRSLLSEGVKDRANVLETTANMLREQVAEKKYIDVGSGVENRIGLNATKLKTAVAMLEEEGYTKHQVRIPQLGTNAGNFTTTLVLAAPGTPYGEVVRNKGEIQQIGSFTEDRGRSYLGLHPPLKIDPSRVDVKYAEDGGKEADGIIYVRPNVKDVSIGQNHYAQVRIAVGDKHFLKGMAMYKEGLPEGTDLQFNTNKHNTGNKLDAMKKIEDDPDNPFKSSVRQIVERDEHGKEHVTSAMNIVGLKEGSGVEGGWESWSKTLSSQFLSKQSPTLAKTQLDMTYEQRRNELDDILKLTNPAVRKKLLESFADAADSSAVHLKAHALPRQSNHVILPINSMKPNEIYAPTFNNGERVVLVRHPHGGTFEIPELTVNNKNREARRLIGTESTDAVGIHHSVAERLSGADFDGDTVLVIPNNQRKVKTTPPLEGLKNFDPQSAFPGYEGMPKMKSSTKEMEMGNVSNLITDMTIKRAGTDDIARAIRHSMVVIDAEKHNLNWRESARVNGIAQLKEKYQGGSRSGASTLISKANSAEYVPKRKGRPAAQGGSVDPVTGKKVFVDTGETYVKNGKVLVRKFKSSKMAETDDAHTLSSGTVMEEIYAEHANKLKGLANEARREWYYTKPVHYSPSAKAVYKDEVDSLNAKLNIALRNRPLERQAQILANATVSLKRQANPNMTAAELKKIKIQALNEARNRTKSGMQKIVISDKEWAAIQAGAISNNKLTQILQKADLDQVKKLATPKTQLLMTSTKKTRAKQMLKSGYTEAEVAQHLGVSRSTLRASLGGE